MYRSHNRFYSAISALSLVGVIAATSINAVFGAPGALEAAGVMLLVYLALEGQLVLGSGRVILVAGGLVSIAAAIWLPNGPQVMGRALAAAASLTGLFTALSFLREAAESSELVKDCGDLMVRQPPGRRYIALAIGSHLIALVLNFGVLSLLGTMVVRGNTAEAAGGDENVVKVRRQRMMTALMRGFAVMTVWSPLSVSFAVTQTVVHGVSWTTLLPLQVILTVLLLALGWVLDRLSFPRPRLAYPQEGISWAPLGLLALLIAAVVAASVLTAELLGVRIIMGAVVIVPFAAFAWLAVQYRNEGVFGSMASAFTMLRLRLAGTLPNFRNEVAMLGGAMYTGMVVAAFIPPEDTARVIGAIGLPPVMLTILLTWVMMAIAQVGVSHIVTVTLLGGALANLSQLGINPVVLASGLMGAWALSTCTTPVGAAVLTISRLSEVPLRTVARDWNGRYVIVGALVIALWLAGLDWVLR